MQASLDQQAPKVRILKFQTELFIGNFWAPVPRKPCSTIDLQTSQKTTERDPISQIKPVPYSNIGAAATVLLKCVEG